MKKLLITLFVFWTALVFAKETIIFQDDFNTNESYEDTLSLNPTSKVYKDNSFREGYQLKKWNRSWEYQYFEGDWKQAFYCVLPGDSVMTQAGRSARQFGLTYRITAINELPENADQYRINFRMKKIDNDPLIFCIGCAKNGYDGIEFGYQNQIPGTDDTIKDAYLIGQFGEGVFKENMAFHRTWVTVSIDVDIARKFITWKMDDKIMARGYARDFKPGGYFGIYMCYERNTQFDDFKIIAIQN